MWNFKIFMQHKQDFIVPKSIIIKIILILLHSEWFKTWLIHWSSTYMYIDERQLECDIYVDRQEMKPPNWNPFEHDQHKSDNHMHVHFSAPKYRFAFSDHTTSKA